MNGGRGDERFDEAAVVLGQWMAAAWGSATSDGAASKAPHVLEQLLQLLSAGGPVAIEDGQVRRLVEADHFGSLRFNGSVKYVYDCVDAEGMIRDGLSLVPLFYVAPVSSREGDGA